MKAQEKDGKAMMRRVERAEHECHVTIMRAIDKCLNRLRSEQREYVIRRARRKQRL